MDAHGERSVYLEAYYPRTSPAFLLASLILFALLTALFAIVAAGFIFWPITIIFALVTLYLAAVLLRQTRGVTLAVRVTDRSVFHAGWAAGLFHKGLPAGDLPLDAIGSVEIVSLPSGRGTGPVVALWLSDPERYRLGRGLFRWVGELAGGGDLVIRCEETDRTAEHVKEAIEAALTDSQNRLYPSGERGP